MFEFNLGLYIMLFCVLRTTGDLTGEQSESLPDHDKERHNHPANVALLYPMFSLGTSKKVR